MGDDVRKQYTKNVALSEATLALHASAVRVSTTAKRLFGRDEHAPSERHKLDFAKAMLFPQKSKIIIFDNGLR